MRGPLLLLALAGCPGRLQLDVRPLPHTTEAGRITLGVIGACEASGPDLGLQADVRTRAVDGLLLTGAVSGAHRQDWVQREAWLTRLDLPALAAVGGDESERTDAFMALHTGSDRTWSSTDLRSGDAVWRLVALDASATGARWQDQLFWLPKVASQAGYDHLVVVLGEAPWTLAADGAGPRGEPARELLDTIHAHAGTDRLRAVISGNTGTQELMLPSGPWGEAWLVAGTSGVAGRGMTDRTEGPHGVELRLAPGLGKELGDGDAPVGWWELELEGDRASVRLRAEVREDRFEERWRIHYTPDEGWTRAVR
ncbi:MAG: hypothetical protein EP330_17180 [Deltaproteobacteria bacterium]|nr:MAG: hypothetical protein EP330_17180 [Deltaproteobacteria bacterium]